MADKVEALCALYWVHLETASQQMKQIENGLEAEQSMLLFVEKCWQAC